MDEVIFEKGYVLVVPMKRAYVPSVPVFDVIDAQLLLELSDRLMNEEA